MPIIRVRDVGANTPATFYSGEYREQYIVKSGDWLVAMDGDFRVAEWKAQDALLNQRVTRLQFFSDEIEKKYVCIALQFELRKLQGVKNYTTVDHLSGSQIADVTIPLPPPNEQTRIVAKVDELMALCDKLEDEQQKRRKLQNTLRQATLQAVASATSPHKLQASWARLEANFGRLFSAPEDVVSLKSLILNIAMRGFLVEQSRLETSAHNQLQAIEAERLQRVADKTIKASTAIPLPRAEELPYSLPKGWAWARVADLVEVGTGATPRKSENDYYGGEIPWYTSAATNDKFARVPETYISEKALRETNCKIFPAGSLIVALYGQGKTRGQVSELTLAGATNQAIAALVFFEASHRTKRFLKYYFEKIYDEIRLQAEGGPQPNLSVGKIKETFVPLPPVEEQERIVSRLDELLGQCEGMSDLLKAKNAAAQQLARATVSSLTGIAIEQEEDEPVKVPKTELISKLRLGQVHVIHQLESHTEIESPAIHPQGMGVTGLLKSELFGLSSTLDMETERRLKRRNDLFVKSPRTADEEAELTCLSTELADLGFSNADFRDPDYALFVRKLAEHRKLRRPNLSAEEIAQQDAIADQIIEEILREEEKDQ